MAGSEDTEAASNPAFAAAGDRHDEKHEEEGQLVVCPHPVADVDAWLTTASSGRASPVRPWWFSTNSTLSIALRVLGWRSPYTRWCACSRSWYSGSASSSLPWGRGRVHFNSDLLQGG